jgi:aminoglycoside/choline kinase family phosphotransferase
MDYNGISTVIQEFLLGKGIDANCGISLAGTAGSLRVYFRIQQGAASYILMQAPKTDTDFGKFLRLTQFYRLLEFPVPRVYCIDDSALQVLLEDLGNVRLFDEAQVNPGNIQALYQRAVDSLLFLQSRCFQQHQECPDIFSRVFDLRDLLWETTYFKEQYLQRHRKIKLSQKSRSWLQKEFKSLAQAVEIQPRTIMHRDFQSQNIMVQNGRIRIIDYQGSRLGSTYYDVASLLLDPYTMLPESIIISLFKYYHAKTLSLMSYHESLHHMLLAGAQRVMQALGAFCFLSEKKKLSYFSQYIPPAERRLTWVLERAGLKEMKKLIGV